ncbi:TetR/AcrR family transcriptional regulator [Actinomadura atramentaria]|uniref:TetR/AcrR family transcriptional regulator n=1 Tax=Actinomadura atramentaria TaxID=1990 RepID=UPI00037775B4|nr:TetR/AcrR family transcriptional regulator [Actinomadura atramentaria]
MSRDGILRAALELFARDGVAGTPLGRLREAAGVSPGAFYHHFSGRQQVVDALFVECLGVYQREFLAELHGFDGVRAAVEGLVAFHVRWCREHPERARFLFTERAPAGDHGRAFFRDVFAWWRERVRDGELARLDPGLVFVVWLGPAQELSRLWLAGAVPAPDDRRIAELGAAAWRALGGKNDDR